jgi:hypothetical protein
VEASEEEVATEVAEAVVSEVDSAAVEEVKLYTPPPPLEGVPCSSIS